MITNVACPHCGSEAITTVPETHPLLERVSISTSCGIGHNSIRVDTSCTKCNNVFYTFFVKKK